VQKKGKVAVGTRERIERVRSGKTSRTRDAKTYGKVRNHKNNLIADFVSFRTI